MMSSAAPASCAQPVRVVSQKVRKGRLTCEVCIAIPSLRYSTDAIGARIARDFPTVAGHACVNARGKTFGCVLASTSIPHVLEHLAIDMQAHAADGDDAVFVGTTEWLDEEQGRALIQLSFSDDLQALRAFRQALDYMNALLLS